MRIRNPRDRLDEGGPAHENRLLVRPVGVAPLS